MPHSSHLGLTIALDHVVRMQPRSMLDVGVGFGKWGFLVREALDFMAGRLDRAEWQVRIDGVDPHPYESPLRKWVYDEIRTADVRDVLGELRGYDLVVLGDVLEHLPKEDGLLVLRSLLAGNRNAIVSTPMDFFEQEVPGNPHERHLSHWTQDDFRDWPYDYDVAGGAMLVVALAGRGATYPTRRHARVSRLAYGVPALRRRGALARVVKRLALALPP